MQLSILKNKLSWPIHALNSKRLSGIKSRKEFYKVIEHERERADRNNHQVSLVVFNLESFPNNSKERKQLVGNIIQEKRRIDEIGWFKKNSVGVILPYTSFHGARKFSVRLSQKLNFILPDSFCSLYCYPLQNTLDNNSEGESQNAEKDPEKEIDYRHDDMDYAEDDAGSNSTKSRIQTTVARIS
jgi:hypothetical protein